MKTKFNWELFTCSYVLIFVMVFEPKTWKTLIFIDMIIPTILISIPAFVLGQIFRLPK